MMKLDDIDAGAASFGPINMPLTYHSITFTPHPSTHNQILATCTCGWSAFGPSPEIQGKAACHDLDIEPALYIEGAITDAYKNGYRNQAMTPRGKFKPEDGRSLVLQLTVGLLFIIIYVTLLTWFLVK